MQAGIAPFAAALFTVLLLQRLHIAGLAIAVAFLTTYYFVEGLAFQPLTVVHRLALLALCATAAGLLIDFAFRPTRAGMAVVACAAAASALWMLWPVLLRQREFMQVLLPGATAVVSIAFLTWLTMRLSENPVRAGAAGLALGLGVGTAAILGASLKLGSLGIALGAASGAFLLPQMITGKQSRGGATFTLPLALTAGLIAVAAMTLAQVPWYSVLLLALVPAATRLPVPDRAPVWLQASLFSLYGFILAAPACYLSGPWTGIVAG